MPTYDNILYTMYIDRLTMRVHRVDLSIALSRELFIIIITF